MTLIVWELKNLKKHKLYFFYKLQNFKRRDFFVSLKKLRKHGFHFLQSYKVQNTWIWFFCKLVNAQKRWISFFFVNLSWWGKIKGTPWTKSAIKFFSSVVWTWFTVRFDANRWTVLAHFEWSSSDFFSQKYFGLTADSTFWLTDSLDGSSKIWEFSM